MVAEIAWRRGTATAADVEALLTACDTAFEPPLSQRVALGSYAKKLSSHAVLFEAWDGGSLVGLVAAYLNRIAEGRAFVPVVCVNSSHLRRGIARRLLCECAAQAKDLGFREVALEVGELNAAAKSLYESLGFQEKGRTGSSEVMALPLTGLGL